MTFVYYREDADDAFYVSNVALFAESARLNPYDSSFGNPSLGTVPMYDFQVYEPVMSLLCRLFRVSAAILMHSFCVPLFLIVSASAYLYLGRVLGKGSFRDGCLYFLLLSTAHLFGGYSGYSEGIFLLGRIWQGKTLYLTIILPVMIAFFLQNEEERSSSLQTSSTFLHGKVRSFNSSSRLSLQLALCALAGMAMNPTSSFVLGFQLLFMEAAVCLKNRSLRSLPDILPFTAIEAAFLFMIYLRTSRYSGQIEAASSAGENFIGKKLTDFYGGQVFHRNLILLLFVLSAILLFFIGTLVDRLYLVYTPALMMLTLWNPWVGRLIAEHVTTVPTYWRVFWLIPAAPAMARAGILLAGRTSKNLSAGLAALACAFLLLAVPFRFTFSIEDRPFQISENWERISPQILKLGKKAVDLKEKPVILACRDFSTTLRQVYTQVELICSREQYVRDLFLYRGKEEEANDRFWLDNAVNGRVEYTENFNEILREKLDEYNVDLIIIGEGSSAMRERLIAIGGETESKTEKYVLMSKR